MTDPAAREMIGSRIFAGVQKPADSATLIIVRRDGPVPRILLGQRSAHHKFMPGKYVFPGGRYDAADGKVKPHRDLAPSQLEKLLWKMRGRPSPVRARGLAVAAVRETYEEVGLLIGPSPAEPDLSGLTFFARAITPPGRTRRFDSRFFVVDAEHVTNIDWPHHAGSGELLTPHWFSFEDTRALDLPIITNDILTRLNTVLSEGGWPEGPVCFQYQVRGAWREEPI